jgi:hypothetical protein
MYQKIATAFGGLATPPGIWIYQPMIREPETLKYLQRHTGYKASVAA